MGDSVCGLHLQTIGTFLVFTSLIITNIGSPSVAVQYLWSQHVWCQLLSIDSASGLTCVYKNS